MTDKSQTQKQEPSPRPPRQPDESLITYIERGDEAEADEGEQTGSDD